MIEQIESNLAAYWASFGMGRRGEIHETQALRWVYTGTPLFNRVISARLHESDADRRIQEVVQTFNDRRAAITWFTGPSSRPADLGERLERYGFDRYEPWRGMALNLKDHKSELVLPSNVTVHHVNDSDTYRAWINVILKSFNLPRVARRVMRDHFRNGMLKDDSDWQHHVAFENGIPMAASTVLRHEDVAGIYLVATVPEARGHGLGTLMTNVALETAKRQDARVAVLHATEDGRRIYERVGFRHYCDIGVYRLSAPTPFVRTRARTLVRTIRRFASRNGDETPRAGSSEHPPNGICRAGGD